MPRHAWKWVTVSALFCVTFIAATCRAEDQETSATGDVSVDGPVLLQLNPPLREDRAGDEESTSDDESFETDILNEMPAPSTDVPEELSQEQESLEENATDPLPKSDAAKEETEGKTKTEDPPASREEPEVNELVPLNDDMIELRDYIRKTMAAYFDQPLNTRDHTAADVLDACLAFGCDTRIQRVSPPGTVNGFTCLCWNYPCAGYRLLKSDGQRIVARLGYGTQQWPAQFLAVLALARVPADYPIRVGEDVRSVQELVESEKASCRSGNDLSFKLIGLTRYLPDDEPWKNDLGETWTKQRLVKEVLNQPVEIAPSGGTYRLLALGYAVDRRLKREKPLKDQYLRAQRYINAFVDYALKLQNPDGSWHPSFFTYRGSGGTVEQRLRSTGHILEWIVCSLPSERLRDPRIARSVGYVGSLLNQQRQHRGVAYQSSRQLGARMHALHALKTYDERVFRPHDQIEAPVEEEKPAEHTALRPAEIQHPDITRLPRI